MSSCFLCDTSYKFSVSDRYAVGHGSQRENHYIKQKPIMAGSSGFPTDSVGITANGSDQQHNNNDKQNYVSYRVNKIEFRASFSEDASNIITKPNIPDYVILFKIPLGRVMLNYYFIEDMKDFILYSKPECVLSYGVYATKSTSVISGTRRQHAHVECNLNVNKPFIVGPNDYVGVLYFFYRRPVIASSAKVWFDVL